MVWNFFSGGVSSRHSWHCVQHSDVSKHPHICVTLEMKRGGASSRTNLKKALQPSGSSLQPSQIANFSVLNHGAQIEHSKAMSYSLPPPNIDNLTSLKVDKLNYRTITDSLRHTFEKYGEINRRCVHPMGPLHSMALPSSASSASMTRATLRMPRMP